MLSRLFTLSLIVSENDDQPRSCRNAEIKIWFAKYKHLVDAYSIGFSLYLSLSLAQSLVLLFFQIFRFNISFLFFCKKHFALYLRAWENDKHYLVNFISIRNVHLSALNVVSVISDERQDVHEFYGEKPESFNSLNPHGVDNVSKFAVECPARRFNYKYIFYLQIVKSSHKKNVQQD